MRRFTVRGDNTIYRERLTWFSDSERAMAYTHVEGIDGVENYDARLTVSPTASGATIAMSADLSAPLPRAREIAEGTQAIFDIGVRAIGNAVPQTVNRKRETPEVTPLDVDHLSINDGPRLSFTTGGADSDTLCLFLHGIGGNRRNWDRQLAAIAPLVRVAAMDLRGYGDSTLGPEQSTIEHYCADILHIMETLKARKLILCGLSYGAWIATSFAMRHSDALDALILSGGCTGMSEASADEREAFRLSREKPMNEGQTPADFAASVIDVIAGPDIAAAQRATLHSSMAAIPKATYADALRCFTNPPESFDFSKLNMPVLLMTGEHDRLAPPGEIRRVAERIFGASRQPDVRFEVIASAGHVCNIEKPDAYNAVLTSFLSRVLP